MCICELMGVSVSLCDPTRCMGRAGGTVGCVAPELCVPAEFGPLAQVNAAFMHQATRPPTRTFCGLGGWGTGSEGQTLVGARTDICTNACVLGCICVRPARGRGAQQVFGFEAQGGDGGSVSLHWCVPWHLTCLCVCMCGVADVPDGAGGEAWSHKHRGD